ncbi:MAG TPA: amidase family protein [Vicinamibacteria bacterium]|nr:amidase family protein [Vicinamibacteria bacterium]
MLEPNVRRCAHRRRPQLSRLRCSRGRDQAVEDMRAAGAVVVDPADLPNLSEWYDELPTTVLNYEFKDGIHRYLQRLGDGAPVRNLEEIIAFNEAHADREMPYFGQERLVASQETGSLEDDAYLHAVRTIQRRTREDGIDALMNEHNLDAIVAPTRDPGWLTDHILGDRLEGGSSAGPAAIAGYPDITIPMGFVSGLPAGISFFGRRGASRC